MAQPNQPTPERAAQGAGKSVPIEDTRPAAEEAQPQERPADEAPAAQDEPVEAEAVEAEIVEDAGPSADEQVAQAKAEAQDWQDKFMRLHAEWDTYRRRTTEQREVEKSRATEKLVTSLLPVIDDFERTIDYATKNGEGGLFDGVKAVHAKLVDVLKKDGVEVIDPAGEAFDALEAQAVATVDDASVPDETVSEVYQRGYKMGTKVLRPAMVTVTSGGPKREKPQEDAEKQK
ncbi:nucleotide exchange factor GrpE [Eggerthella guodeyinii]|uniref:Protein GrpE n=2 Tax=Eggerthella TaxID=84111 RepID=A0A6N7RL70_9ACTN|nr:MULTISPECIES: nucleotide exchange factor GrpE [Eggerthella]MBC5584609.1 nucleotide exchange factor GrpE [Eggerthella hominis]MRX81687.1 nucleotide exchange factor GrpE [Eggerthella guodeyinii]QOS68267.1 nucleotide exchange factor GrpE [Eggerthella guodeyinii]